jgi:hypothetical protein
MTRKEMRDFAMMATASAIGSAIATFLVIVLFGR